MKTRKFQKPFGAALPFFFSTLPSCDATSTRRCHHERRKSLRRRAWSEKLWSVEEKISRFCAHSLSVLSNLMSEFCHRAPMNRAHSCLASQNEKRDSSLSRALRNRWNFSYNSVKYQTTRKLWRRRKGERIFLPRQGIATATRIAIKNVQSRLFVLIALIN